MWQFPATEGETQGPGAAGALVKMEGVSAGGGGTMVYFSSADCAVEASRADAAGGTVVRPKTSLGEYGNMALITDTEGNMVGVHSMGREKGSVYSCAQIIMYGNAKKSHKALYKIRRSLDQSRSRALFKLCIFLVAT